MNEIQIRQIASFVGFEDFSYEESDDSLLSGWLLYWNYVNEDDFLLSMGVVKTKDMYLYAENNLDKLKKVKNIDNSSSFIIITFNELKNKCDMIIYECGGSKFYKKP